MPKRHFSNSKDETFLINYLLFKDTVTATGLEHNPRCPFVLPGCRASPTSLQEPGGVELGLVVIQQQQLLFGVLICPQQLLSEQSFVLICLLSVWLQQILL